MVSSKKLVSVPLLNAIPPASKIWASVKDSNESAKINSTYATHKSTLAVTSVFFLPKVSLNQPEGTSRITTLEKYIDSKKSTSDKSSLLLKKRK